MKNSIVCKSSSLLVSVLLSSALFSQTGPSGTGNSSNTMIWLDAHALNASDGVPIAIWNDLSGNGSNFNQFVSARQPLYNSVGISSIPSLSFDGINDGLKSDAIGGLNAANITYFMVYDRTTTTSDMLITAKYASSANKWRTYMNSGQNTIISAQYSPSINWVRYTDPVGASFFSTHITPTQIKTYNQGNLVMTKSATFTAPTGHNNVFLGNPTSETVSSYTFTGQIAEVIVYNSILTDLQRILVENYLGAKYQFAIPTDLYAYDLTHRFGLIALGNDGVNLQSAAQGAGVLELTDPTTLSSNEYFLVAHTDFSLDVFNESDLPASLPDHQRYERTWKVDETGETGDVTLTFYLGLDDFANADSYRLLIDSDGVFSDATVVLGTYDGGTSSVSFTLNLNDGDLFTLAGIQEILEIHSVTDGFWGSTSTWDCGCIPSINDLVFIESATTVTIDVPAVADMLQIEIDGVLEMTTDQSLAITGDLSIFGTLTFSNGTVSFIGNGVQNILNSVSSPTVSSFNDVIVDNSGTGEVSFFNGTFILNGTLSALSGAIVFSPDTDFIISSTSPTSGGKVGPIISPASIAGNVIVQRFIPAGLADWRNLCSPVVDNTFNDWDPDLAMSGPDFPDGCASGLDEPCFRSIRYTEHNTLFEVLSSTEPIENGRGFEVFVGSDLAIFDGTTLNNRGELNSASGITKSFSTGWTTIGNPYACPIAYNAISKSSSISKYFYVYDSNTGAYQWYDQLSGTSSIPEITADGLIGTGQAVWIFATSAGTMTFEQANKRTVDALFIRGSEPTNSSLELKLEALGTDFYSTIQFATHEQATDELDVELDIRDFKTGHEKAPSLSLIAEEDNLRKNYIRSFEGTHSFQLAVQANAEGLFRFSLSNLPENLASVSVDLIDHYTADTIHLNQQSFECYLNVAEVDQSRFELLIHSSVQKQVESDKNKLTLIQSDHLILLDNKDETAVKTSFVLFDLTGRTIFTIEEFMLNDGATSIVIPEHLKGIYIVQIINENDELSKKITLK